MTWSSREFEQQWREKRALYAAQHDDGAAAALADAVYENHDVDCGSYCYGGSAKLDVPETLADLAEAGWRLVRVGVGDETP